MANANEANNPKHNNEVITRFAPSPTGFLHLGSARTALFNYLYAKKNGGKMLLRIEDTDKNRSKKEYEEDILNGLNTLGIKWDNSGEIIRQSERGDIYKKYLKEMIDAGNAYEAEDSADRTGKVIRFKNPNKEIRFQDLIRGDIKFDTTELGDFIIAKNMDTPLYHLAVVVDDFEMGITHIIRGEDGISNTPRQILIQKAIGAKEPKYAHIPLILAPDKSKLSKRHGAVSVNEYIKRGYLPEAIVNFLALIGWNPGDEREIFSMDELIKEFSLEKVQKSGAVFNQDKLDWINKQHIKKLNSKEIMNILKANMPENVMNIKGMTCDKFEKILPVVLERINVFSDIEKMAQDGELQYFFAKPEYEKEKLLWKDEKDVNKTKERIENIVNIIQKIPDNDFSSEKIKEAIWDYATKEGRGHVLWPIRFALSGRDKSPNAFILAQLLGKDETIERLRDAIEKLSS